MPEEITVEEPVDPSSPTADDIAWAEANEELIEENS